MIHVVMLRMVSERKTPIWKTRVKMVRQTSIWKTRVKMVRQYRRRSGWLTIEIGDVELSAESPASMLNIQCCSRCPDHSLYLIHEKHVISSLNFQKYLYAFGVIWRKTKLKFDQQ